MNDYPQNHPDDPNDCDFFEPDDTPPAPEPLPPERPMVDYVPFHGEPPEPMSKSAKIFFGILIALAASFVIAFLVWVATLAVNKFSSPADSPDTSQKGTSSQIFSFESSPKPVQNKVGTNTNPQFPGIVLNPPTASELSPKQIYQQVEPAIVGILSESSGSGSGIASGMILTPDGYLLTNAHVVDFSRDTKVTVVLSNKTRHTATVVGYDRTSDLAVLKIGAQGLPTVTFGSSAALSIGDWVFALGNPRSLNFSGTLTRGIVSGLDRHILYKSENSVTYIQTDAAINPGNSGGALVNSSGQVIGINSIKLNPEHYEGMGFSIAINKAKPIIDSLIQNGYVTGRVRLGITGMTLSNRGVQIVGLSEGSALEGTQVQTGDILVKLDEKTVLSMDDLDDLLLDYQPGDTVTLTFSREKEGGGKTFTVETELLPDTGQLQK